MAGDMASESTVAVRAGLGHDGPRPFVHADRHLQLRGKRVDRKVVGMAKCSALEPVRAPENARQAQLLFCAAEFLYRELRIVQRDERNTLEPCAVMAAILGQPVVVGPADGG